MGHKLKKAMSGEYNGVSVCACACVFAFAFATSSQQAEKNVDVFLLA